MTNGNCYLKNKNSPSRSTFDIRPLNVISCGFLKSKINWTAWSEGLFAYNCDDLNHNDLRYIKPMGKSADCGPACNQDNRCTHWVWTGDGTCYLKSVSNASKSTFSLIKNPGTSMVCGLAKSRS
ncbi:hypothetical protein BC833DRAFT_623648 [Globomyces pollinis-pini]|nr:hypothetical protein BC833DRAFT_623648 [Globomyces pollinis-pini]